nr:uncharacterized protein LOC127327106 [Lolium perenne]
MSPGCCRDKRPPFPRRCLDECRSSPSLLTEADEIVSTGSSAAATARALEGYAAAPRPGVDGRGPFMPRLRLEGRRRPKSQPTGVALDLLEVDRTRIGVLPPHGLSGNKERDRVRPRSVNKELRYVRSRVPLLGILRRRMI